MYNVFCDFHHASLLESFIFLFEKRLGGQVYRPIGKEWWEQGFWKVYDHPATVEQYLGIGGATPDGTPPLNEIEGYTALPGFYHCHDIDSGKTNKAITLEAFLLFKIDIVIASLPYHIEPFRRLCALHPDHPKLIYQIGNAWTVEAGTAPNIMASALIDNVPPDAHFISYHQEFDTGIFNPGMEAGSLLHIDTMPVTVPDKNVFSFVNCFDTAGHFQSDWQLFQILEQQMPDWSFKSYGGQCRDGAVGPSTILAETMRKARFIWHTKAGGDGYGHVLHNAAACGRPLIVKKQYYAGKLGDRLLIDGKTCIAIDGMSPDEIKNKIEYYSEYEAWKTMAWNAYSNFLDVCDFDAEFEQLKDFLAALV